MTELDEQTIRERAHRLWEQAGKPEGMTSIFGARPNVSFAKNWCAMN